MVIAARTSNLTSDLCLSLIIGIPKTRLFFLSSDTYICNFLVTERTCMNLSKIVLCPLEICLLMLTMVNWVRRQHHTQWIRQHLSLKHFYSFCGSYGVLSCVTIQVKVLHQRTMRHSRHPDYPPVVVHTPLRTCNV